MVDGPSANFPPARRTVCAGRLGCGRLRTARAMFVCLFVLHLLASTAVDSALRSAPSAVRCCRCRPATILSRRVLLHWFAHCRRGGSGPEPPAVVNFHPAACHAPTRPRMDYLCCAPAFGLPARPANVTSPRLLNGVRDLLPFSPTDLVRFAARH